MDEWVVTLEQILYRLADGSASDEDVLFILNNLPAIGDDLQERLNDFAGDPNNQKNIQIALAVLNTYKMYKLFS